MAKIELNWPDSVPQDQIDIPFLQGMLNRMAFGFHNYGHMRRWNKRSNSLENIRIRLQKYEESKNTEFLMDAANFAMMEFCVPSLPGAFFKPTTKDESPGAIVDGKLAKGKEDYESKRIVREGGLICTKPNNSGKNTGKDKRKPKMN